MNSRICVGSILEHNLLPVSRQSPTSLCFLANEDQDMLIVLKYLLNILSHFYLHWLQFRHLPQMDFSQKTPNW